MKFYIAKHPHVKLRLKLRKLKNTKASLKFQYNCVLNKLNLKEKYMDIRESRKERQKNNEKIEVVLFKKTFRNI